MLLHKVMDSAAIHLLQARNVGVSAILYQNLQVLAVALQAAERICEHVVVGGIWLVEVDSEHQEFVEHL